jgi:cytochrome c peroxidase
MSRLALTFAILAGGFAARSPAADPIVYLDQGWSAADRQTYYYLPQGSELMPYAWFLALEQPWNDKPFRDPAHIEAFRYIPADAGAGNPDGLPVGFTKGRDRAGKEWFGLTCAACHTGQFTYKGKTVRVDGGTTLADAIGFQSALVSALRATVHEPRKFDRFSNRVLGGEHSPDAAKQLRHQVREHLEHMANWEATSRPAHPTGFGTWDAVNILMNTVNATAPGVPANYRTPMAPVSYPSIWLSNQYDALLWNASVRNVTLRQVGEVIIVFGRAKAELTPSGAKFDSSTDLKSLAKVDYYVSALSPPSWPEDVLGKIDRTKAKRGGELYKQAGCASCHPTQPYPQTDPENGKRYIRITRTPVREVGTDPTYADYFVRRTATPGPLAPAFKGSIFEGRSTMPAAILFLATLTKITEAEVDRLAVTPEERAKLLGYRPLPALPKTEAELAALVESLSVYKAAPLAGVWATAPYLHNGSVPSLYDLMLPPAQRSKAFFLGNRVFDPERVGYRTEPFEGGYRYDTSLPGQSNRGHEYGTDLAEEDRRALVEYLKTL